MNHRTIDQTFTRESWEDDDHIRDYVDAVTSGGLWDSERILVGKYVPQGGALLDIGCGAGRTTFGSVRIRLSQHHRLRRVRLDDRSSPSPHLPSLPVPPQGYPSHRRCRHDTYRGPAPFGSGHGL